MNSGSGGFDRPHLVRNRGRCPSLASGTHTPIDSMVNPCRVTVFDADAADHCAPIDSTFAAVVSTVTVASAVFGTGRNDAADTDVPNRQNPCDIAVADVPVVLMSVVTPRTHVTLVTSEPVVSAPAVASITRAPAP